MLGRGLCDTLENLINVQVYRLVRLLILYWWVGFVDWFRACLMNMISVVWVMEAVKWDHEIQ